MSEMSRHRDDLTPHPLCTYCMDCLLFVYYSSHNHAKFFTNFQFVQARQQVINKSGGCRRCGWRWGLSDVSFVTTAVCGRGGNHVDNRQTSR